MQNTHSNVKCLGLSVDLRLAKCAKCITRINQIKSSQRVDSKHYVLLPGESATGNFLTKSGS